MGRRVSVRRIVDRTADGRALTGDVVGDLVGLDTRIALVETRAGRVEVALPLVTAARLVRPSTADELALERVAAQGWRAEYTHELGGWLLRAAGGFTGRANSVLPLHAPGLPLDDALATAGAWYAGHRLPLRIQVPTPSRRLLDAELAARGWSASPTVHVMAARLDQLPAARSDVDVDLTTDPGAGWLRRFRDGVGLEPVARGVLTRHDTATFAAVRDRTGTTVAIGRGTVDDGWLGITAMEVARAARRRGLAGAIMRALRDWGVGAGATRSHLEVGAENTAALALYAKLGYWVHHDYRYRAAP